MIKLVRVVLVISMFTTILVARQGLVFNAIEGNAEAGYNELVNKKIGSIGFTLSDPHERINDAYEVKYGTKTSPQYDPDWKKNLDNLGFFTISQDVKLRELLIRNPELGAFSPFNLHVYKKMSEDKTYVGHIVPDVMLDIVDIQDKKVREEFISIFKPLDELVQKELGGKVEFREFSSLPETKMMKFEFTFDRPEDLTDYLDTFQEEFEEAMEAKQYIIAGFKDFKEAYTYLELPFDKYDAYYSYSLCHFTFSYNMFNKGMPEAGAFAPCSMYMYIEKGTNKLVIGMPLLDNWLSVLNIKDEVMKKSVTDLDKEIIDIMISLGAKKI